MAARVKTGEVWLNCGGVPVLHDLPLHPTVQEQVTKGLVQIESTPKASSDPATEAVAVESAPEFDVTDHTAAEVLAHLEAISDGEARQFEALRLAETEREVEKPRTTLLAKLDAIAGD